MDNGIEMVLDRLNQTEGRFDQWAGLAWPLPELEAQLVARFERLMVVALCRGRTPGQVCRLVGIDAEFLDVIVAERATEPAVIAACAARPEALAAALGALDD